MKGFEGELNECDPASGLALGNFGHLPGDTLSLFLMSVTQSLTFQTVAIDEEGHCRMIGATSKSSLDQWPFELFLYFARFLDATDLLTLRLVSEFSTDNLIAHLLASSTVRPISTHPHDQHGE